jgi:hypothetical protein
VTQVFTVRTPTRGWPTPEQWAIRPGDCVLSEPGGQFDGLRIYGFLFTRALYIEAVRADPADPPESRWLEDDLAWREYRFSLGYAWGTFFSVGEPEGETGETHLSTCTRIGLEEFEAARLRGWR